MLLLNSRKESGTRRKMLDRMVYCQLRLIRKTQCLKLYLQAHWQSVQIIMYWCHAYAHATLVSPFRTDLQCCPSLYPSKGCTRLQTNMKKRLTWSLLLLEPWEAAGNIKNSSTWYNHSQKYCWLPLINHNRTSSTDWSSKSLFMFKLPSCWNNRKNTLLLSVSWMRWSPRWTHYPVTSLLILYL